MKLFEFYHQYANVPLKLRFVPISFAKGGITTLSQIDKRLKELDKQECPIEKERKKLLELASIFFEHNNRTTYE